MRRIAITYVQLFYTNNHMYGTFKIIPLDQDGIHNCQHNFVKLLFDMFRRFTFHNKH